MPNWCENKLVVRGEEKDMAKFKKTMEVENLLNSFVPMPKKEDANWYQWANNNWGTKWDVEVHNSMIEDDYVELSFDSAWGPPIAWVEIVARKYPKLKFSLKYDEPGLCFMGCAKGSNGKIETQTIEYWEK